MPERGTEKAKKKNEGEGGRGPANVGREKSRGVNVQGGGGTKIRGGKMEGKPWLLTPLFIKNPKQETEGQDRPEGGKEKRKSERGGQSVNGKATGH